MGRRNLRWPIRWIIGVIVVAFLAALLLSPIAKPPDTVRKIYLGPKIKPFERMTILPTAHSAPGWFRNRKAPYRPQFVELKSNGPTFRAYLLDLSIVDSGDKVKEFMKASDEIAQHMEPATATLKDKAVDVSQARFRLYRFPIGLSRNFDYMLIVASDNEVEIEVRTNYGR
jgi:hypothetical protein